MLTLAQDNDLPELLGYMYTNWYRPERFCLWGRHVARIITIHMTNMLSEAQYV
jgi:hypothetical protein